MDWGEFALTVCSRHQRGMLGSSANRCPKGSLSLPCAFGLETNTLCFLAAFPQWGCPLKSLSLPPPPPPYFFIETSSPPQLTFGVVATSWRSAEPARQVSFVVALLGCTVLLLAGEFLHKVWPNLSLPPPPPPPQPLRAAGQATNIDLDGPGGWRGEEDFFFFFF